MHHAFELYSPELLHLFCLHAGHKSTQLYEQWQAQPVQERLEMGSSLCTLWLMSSECKSMCNTTCVIASQ